MNAQYPRMVKLYLFDFQHTEPVLPTSTLRLNWSINHNPAGCAKRAIQACQYGRAAVRRGDCTSFHVVTGEI